MEKENVRFFARGFDMYVAICCPTRKVGACTDCRECNGGHI